jgi:hypothetical protein
MQKEFYKIVGNNIILDSILAENIVGKELIISYRSYDMPIKQSYATLDTTLLERKAVQGNQVVYDLTPNLIKQSKLIDGKNIEYNGSFARGFSVGNAQSLVVNSKFDLQLQGEIGGGIKINAAISDDNVPIQVEGNTQVLQEFDRIFIELSKDNSQLIAGDFVLNRPNSYFMNYYKKLKGIGIKSGYEKEKIKTVNSGYVANSRGKFARQTLVNREGNQGPYKLQGNNNERFIIVLSGTEKVYFNGVLIKRGQEYDYTIDYNLGEISFTPNKIIAKESRIIIEFEYTDQNYYRTLYAASSETQWKNSRFAFNFYSEQDSKTSTGTTELDSTTRETLISSGDNDDKYVVSTLRSASVNDQIVKYEIIPNPNYPTDRNEYYLLYSNNPNTRLFSSSFSEVGIGKGSYVIDPSNSVNGRIYKFVGYGKGSYDPITKVIPPEQKQMMDLTMDLELKKFGQLSTNLALTNFDKNRLSQIDDGDNIGLAGIWNYRNRHTLSKKVRDSVSLQYFFSAEINNDKFKPLNQYRDAEFNRDWNYKSSQLLNDKIYIGQVGIESSSLGISLRYNSFSSSNIFDGNRWRLNVRINQKGFSFNASPSILSSIGNGLNTAFIRPNFILNQSVNRKRNLSFGVELESEDNQKKFSSIEYDSTSYKFSYWKTFMTFGDLNKNGLRFSYNKRDDEFATKLSLEDAINITEYELNAAFANKKSGQFQANLKFRNFEVENPILAKNDKSKRTLLGSIIYNLSLWKSGLLFSNNYQVNSGQTPKIEYVFQRVENLRGDYVYIGNDTVKNKNINDFRFDPTNPLAQYTRFTLANNEFTTTNNIALTQSFKFEPAKFLKADSLNTVAKKILYKFSNNSIVRISNQTDANNNNINYFNFSNKDTNLVSYQRNIVSTTIFNKGNSLYDVAYTYRDNGSKTNQINGFEERSIFEHEWKARINVYKSTDFFISYITGMRFFKSKLFSQRNLELENDKISAEVNYRYGTKMRIGLKANYANSNQQIEALETTRKLEYIISFNRRSIKSNSIDTYFSMLNISYKGQLNSPIIYDLLEGFQPGINYTWGINLTKRVTNSIDLTLVYDARKSGSLRSINVAKIQAKATF